MKKVFAPFVSLVVATAVVFGFALGVSPVGATTTAEYAAYTVNGTTGSVSFVGNFPSATFTSQRTVQGPFTSAVLDASTPFGAVYGSSVGQSFIRLSSPSNSGSSSTVFTFASATPATGYGFTLGDVDAEAVTISATTTGGVAVTAAELGYTDSFNYASGADLPTWNAGTSTLIGNVADTSGASGWFSPTVPLVTITFTSTTLSGSPDYQVWMAALIPVPATTTTTTTTTTPATTPSTNTPISIDPTLPASRLPATGDDLNFAFIALSVLIIGLITVVTRKRLHDSRPQ
jgi:LPXTG-motif cell wall-anchored protein